MDERVQHFLRKQQQQHHAMIDRMFGGLMLIQWAASVAAAYWVAPLTWQGSDFRPHPHLWLAFGCGGAIASLPVLLDIFFAGRTLTRHVNSVAQVLFSILLIHVTGGRIETHFHVFGSLAFLACYRDWKVLIPATVIVAADHFIRGIWWPESVFGIASASYWRWLEHAGWVLFEDIVLTIACIQGVAEMRSIAARTVALENTDRWKKSILEAALDAVVSINGEGRITEWNSKAETIFGWSASEVMGRPLEEVIIPLQYREKHRQGLANFHRTRIGPVLNRRIELSAVRRDGSEFPVELVITPIQEQDQLSFCGFIRDITARNLAEKELRSAKDAAEAANQAKSTFLANMSHEIRTPLNGILGFNELLRRGADRGDDAKRREFIETIERSGRHLLSIVNDLLDLSKIEAGQLEVDRISCSPHEVFAEVVSILRVSAQTKGLSLDYFWDGEMPLTIETDPDRLRQILVNLVGNAVKFTEHGSVTISASLVRDGDEPQAWLKVSVKDTGIGVAPEKLDSIFEPFVQGDSSVTRRFGGTGLGLSICKRLCHLLGGFMEVQSQVGLGSVFSFTLDVGVPQFGTEKYPVSGDIITSTTPAGSSTNRCLQGRNILLVEDGEINRRLIQIELEDAGAHVTLAENGEIGLHATDRQSFDAVLLDMQMPVMDGYVAATEMRKAGVKYPIIALTAHSMAGDAEKCLAAGCSHFMSKPIQSDKLLRTLVAALGDANASSPKPKTEMHHLEQNSLVPLRSTLPLEKPVFREIVQDYLDTLEHKMEELDDACREEDLEQIQQLTHALKGSGGTAGYQAITVAADEVMRAVHLRDQTIVPQKLDQLRHVIQRAVAGRPV
jgi:two-component system, sensor histidine kinase and response regulator